MEPASKAKGAGEKPEKRRHGVKQAAARKGVLQAGELRQGRRAQNAIARPKLRRPRITDVVDVRVTEPRASELAQVRLKGDEVEALETVMEWLEISSRSDALREGLYLLAREATEVRAAEEIKSFYGSEHAPLPEGVVPATEDELAAADAEEW